MVDAFVPAQKNINKIKIHVQVINSTLCGTKHKGWLMSHEMWPQIPVFKAPLPDTSTVWVQGVTAASLSVFSNCNGVGSNTGLKGFTTSVLYITISDCKQIGVILQRCYDDRPWVSVVAWIKGNKAVSLTACAVIGLILCGFPVSDCVNRLRDVKAHQKQHMQSKVPLCCTAGIAQAAKIKSCNASSQQGGMDVWVLVIMKILKLEKSFFLC